MSRNIGFIFSQMPTTNTNRYRTRIQYWVVEFNLVGVAATVARERNMAAQNTHIFSQILQYTIPTQKS